MGIKTVPHPPYIPDVAPCDFWLFHKLRGCRYETIEEMKEAVTKVIDTLIQENFHAAFHKFFERYNKCIRRGLEFHVCTINKSAHTKKCLETYSMILVFHIYMNKLDLAWNNPQTKPNQTKPITERLILLASSHDGVGIINRRLEAIHACLRKEREFT